MALTLKHKGMVAICGASAGAAVAGLGWIIYVGCYVAFFLLATIPACYEWLFMDDIVIQNEHPLQQDQTKAVQNV